MLATVMNMLDLVPQSWVEVDEAIKILVKLKDEMVLEIPSDHNPAKRLALSLKNMVGRLKIQWFLN